MDSTRIKRAIRRRFKRAIQLVGAWYRRTRNGVLRYFVPNDDDQDSNRVTTTNLEEHRRQILEQARRHVKPHISTNSNVVRNSIIVGALALVAVVIGLYLSVYRFQPTNNFYYRLSQILPIPVGEIAGHNVEYDRVLFYFRAESRADSFELSQDVAANDDDKQERLRRSFLSAREAVYIEALAEAQEVGVSDEEVTKIISGLPLLESGSADLDVVLQEFRGWTRDDLFRETRIEALKSSKLIPQQVRELTQASSFEQFQELSSRFETNGAKIGKLSEINELPDAVRQASRQIAVGETSSLVDTKGTSYVLFKRADSVRFVEINSGLRKQLLEAQAANATSRSCLSNLTFGDEDAAITAEAGYTSCIF